MSKQIYVTTTQHRLKFKQKIYKGTQDRQIKEQLCMNVLTSGRAYERYNRYSVQYSCVVKCG